MRKLVQTFALLGFLLTGCNRTTTPKEIEYDEFNEIVESSKYGSHTKGKIKTKTTENGVTYSEEFLLKPVNWPMYYRGDFEITMWQLEGEASNPEQTCLKYLAETSNIVDAKDFNLYCQEWPTIRNVCTFYKNPLRVTATQLSGARIDEWESGRAYTTENHSELTILFRKDLFPSKMIYSDKAYVDDKLVKDVYIEGDITYLD